MTAKEAIDGICLRATMFGMHEFDEQTKVFNTSSPWI